MEIDREPHTGDEADRATYFIESVIENYCLTIALPL